MSAITIAVTWQAHQEIEYIDIPTSPGIHNITRTLDWWQWERQFKTYQTDGQASVSSDGTADIRIAYREEDNSSDVAGSVWGVVELRISPDQIEGTANWYPEGGSKVNVKWRSIPQALTNELLEPKGRHTRSAINRDENFRLAVLVEDGRCVITGEETQAILDAAHVIPAARHGADVIGNAIMLRADLHRLYDRGYFTIDRNGFVNLTDLAYHLPGHYRELLEGSQIDSAALERVRNALEVIAG